MADRAEVGEALRRLRGARGYRLEELSTEVDVPVSTLSRWENGHSEPRATDLARILAALGASYEDYEHALKRVREGR